MFKEDNSSEPVSTNFLELRQHTQEVSGIAIKQRASPQGSPFCMEGAVMTAMLNLPVAQKFQVVSFFGNRYRGLILPQ